jgi:Co/Zn/Cd efflux system component
MLAFALWVLANTTWHAFYGTVPHTEVMGVVGIAALFANGGVALMLYRFRTGWPDVVVAAVMGGLGLWGGWQIVSQARGELRSERAGPLPVATK